MNTFLGGSMASKISIAMGLALGLWAQWGAGADRAEAQVSLRLSANDSWHVGLGRCGETNDGLLLSKVNKSDSSPVCLPSLQAAASADAATQSAVLELGNSSGTELIRIDSASQVRQIFSVIAPPANPLELPVDRLGYFQATATNCSDKAIFSFASVNGSGPTQRGWGERDVRINPVYELPTEWTEEKLRHEILFEQAAFRGIVERPTFDILHPFNERPLLVTVFDLLPLVRSTDRCAL
jgi:hypothetical protein